MARKVPSLQPGCPWYELSEMAPPNVKWCEESLCSWITEPANTWSNLGYIFVGLWLWRLALGSKSLALRKFGPAVVIVGVSSFVYHASYNFFLQVFDFFGMFVFCYLLILLNLRRLNRISKESQARWFWGLTLASTAGVVVLDRLEIVFQPMIFILILAIIFTEALNRKRSRAYSLRFFWLSLFLMLVGGISSGLDVSRVWCDPQNHWLQGHATWHVMTALALASSFFHYRQFEKSL